MLEGKTNFKHSIAHPAVYTTKAPTRYRAVNVPSSVKILTLARPASLYTSQHLSWRFLYVNASRTRSAASAAGWHDQVQ
jgi:hypothetical protein